MKKGMALLIILITVVAILCILKNNKKEVVKEEVETNPYQEVKFYKKENLERYKKYSISNPDLNSKDIVLRVNMNLDNSFYTNTKEVKEFNLLMLVNKYNYLAKDFEVPNLVKVEEYAKEGMYLEEKAKDAFIKMANDIKKEGYNLRAISTYRTYDYQSNLYNNYAKCDGVNNADTYSARPGFSEHHTGLAIDVDNITKIYTDFEDTDEFTWMQENAYKYGFILRYPKDKENITGYIYEPWHYRYVGLSVAKYIHENNLTFEEYYYEFLDNKLERS